MIDFLLWRSLKNMGPLPDLLFLIILSLGGNQILRYPESFSLGRVLAIDEKVRANPGNIAQCKHGCPFEVAHERVLSF